MKNIVWKKKYCHTENISWNQFTFPITAKVDGVLWDLDRPLEKSSKLALIKFDDEEGQAVFWHSSAHILGEAMERVYGGHLCYGPPIESGFYYDMHSEDYRVSEIFVKDLFF